MSEQRDFKGVWISKEIWLNKELTLLEKCIYTEIDSLDNENHCTAGNEYFAEFCDCSTSKVTKAIKKLQDLGMIEVMSFDGRHRQLRLVKSTKQTSKKYEADSYKVRANNIDNNTKHKSIISKDIIDSNTQKFIDEYHSMCNLPKVVKITDKRKKAIQKILQKYSWEEIREVFYLADQSSFLNGLNDRGWKADIDFILREDKFINILEGKYGGKIKDKTKFNLEGSTVPYTDVDKISDEQWRKEMNRDGKSTKF